MIKNIEFQWDRCVTNSYGELQSTGDYINITGLVFYLGFPHRTVPLLQNLYAIRPSVAHEMKQRIKCEGVFLERFVFNESDCVAYYLKFHTSKL